MSLNDMLAKNSPIGDKRKTSESEYLRLLGRNTELVDKIKWLERDNKELQDRIDRVIEYIEENTKEGIIKDKRYFYSPEQAQNIIEILGSDRY